MIDYGKKLQAAEQFGLVPIPGQKLFRLMVRGQKVAELTPDEADLLAIGCAGRLDVTNVVPTPCGIEGTVGLNGETVHLCYSDDAELFARAVMAASGLDEVAR